MILSTLAERQTARQTVERLTQHGMTFLTAATIARQEREDNRAYRPLRDLSCCAPDYGINMPDDQHEPQPCRCESSLCDHDDTSCDRPADPRLIMWGVGHTCTSCAASMCATGGSDYVNVDPSFHDGI